MADQPQSKLLSASFLETFGIAAQTLNRETLAELSVPRNVKRLVAGKPVDYIDRIGDVEIPATVEYKGDALLRRMAHMVQSYTPDSGREGTFDIVTGHLSDVKLAITFKPENEEPFDLDTLLRSILSAAVGTELSVPEYVKMRDEMQFTVDSGMFFYFQQMGADKAKYDEAVEAFQAMGAVAGKTGPNEPSNRMRSAYAISESKAPRVEWFDMGKSDVEITRNQGFYGPGGTVVRNLESKLQLLGQATALWTEAESIEDAEEREAKREESRTAWRMSRSWANTWTGSRVERDENGNITVIYNGAGPVGRLNVVDRSDNSVEFNFWKSPAQQGSEDVVLESPTARGEAVPTPDGGTGGVPTSGNDDEEPF